MLYKGSKNKSIHTLILTLFLASISHSSNYGFRCVLGLYFRGTLRVLNIVLSFNLEGEICIAYVDIIYNNWHENLQNHRGRIIINPNKILATRTSLTISSCINAKTHLISKFNTVSLKPKFGPCLESQTSVAVHQVYL